MKADQDEASPAALRLKAPATQDLLLAELEGVLRRNLLEAHDAGSVHPCDGKGSNSYWIARQRRRGQNQQPREAWVHPLPRTQRAWLQSAPLRNVVSFSTSGQYRGPQQGTAWAPLPRVFQQGTSLGRWGAPH